MDLLGSIMGQMQKPPSASAISKEKEAAKSKSLLYIF